MSDKDYEWLEQLKKEHPEWFEKVRVLELGSRNINGTVRDYFKAKEFVGVDWIKGKDVDVVCYNHETKFKKEYFDVIISFSCFEHDYYWKESIIHNLPFLKREGIIMFSWGGKGSTAHGLDYDAALSEFKNLSSDSDYYRSLQAEGGHYHPKAMEEMADLLKDTEIIFQNTYFGSSGEIHQLMAKRL